MTNEMFTKTMNLSIIEYKTLWEKERMLVSHNVFQKASKVSKVITVFSYGCIFVYPRAILPHDSVDCMVV